MLDVIMMVPMMLADVAQAAPESVQQLQESINNGVLPAYIGIPILKEKMERQSQAQAMEQPPATPIAQEIMSQASGVNQLPSNLPTQAPQGGIAAFGGGGSVGSLLDEDPYDFQTEEEEYMDTLNNLYTAAMGISAMSSYPDKTMYSKENVTPNVEPTNQQAGEMMNTYQPGGRMISGEEAPAPVRQQVSQPSQGISDLIQNAAGRYNLPPDLMQNIAGAESSGRSDAANPRSSAKGIYQFIDPTWESLGGTPGNQFDPQENVELGAKYIRQNVDKLRDDLGRNPTYAETYAAHYFGPGVSKMIANASPEDPIEVGLAMFNSPKTVDRILQSNPNLQDKTVGEVIASLEGKAGEGIVELARGGVVGYADGGIMYEDEDMLDLPYYLGQAQQEYGTTRQQLIRDYPWRNQITDPAGHMALQEQDRINRERLRNLEQYQEDLLRTPVPEAMGSFRDIGNLRETVQKQAAQGQTSTIRQPAPPQETPKKVEPKPPVSTVDLTKQAPIDKKTLNVTESMATQATKAPNKSLSDIFLERFEKADSNAQKQREMDAYTALATAGFAAAAGTSPNAIQNIAQGALAGMGQYGNLQKQRVEEQLAREKNLLTAQRYQELGEAARATQALTSTRMTAEEQNRLDTQMRGIKDAYMEQINKMTTVMYDKDPSKPDQVLQERLKNDPHFNALFKQRFGIDYATAVGSKQPASSGKFTYRGVKEESN